MTSKLSTIVAAAVLAFLAIYLGAEARTVAQALGFTWKHAELVMRILALVALVMTIHVIEVQWPEVIAHFEEIVLALLLALMTLVSFTQVVARYGFNTGWGGALEFTRLLFAWMILFGMNYGVKIGSHLGVDAGIRLFPPKIFRVLAVFGALCGVLYAAILISADWLQIFGIQTRGGAIAYWTLNFRTGIGLDDLRYPDIIQHLFGTKERVQRWIVYLVLPTGLAFFAFRCLQAAIAIIKGEREMMIAAHEAEDLVAENKDALKD